MHLHADVSRCGSGYLVRLRIPGRADVITWASAYHRVMPEIEWVCRKIHNMPTGQYPIVIHRKDR